MATTAPSPSSRSTIRPTAPASRPFLPAICAAFVKPWPEPQPSARRAVALFQRLNLDDRRAVIAAGPEGDRRRGIVDEHAPYIGGARQQIVDRLPGFGVEPRDLIAQHRAGPGLSVLVGDDVVGRRPSRPDLPLLELFGPGVEHADAVSAIFTEPQPVLCIHGAAARCGSGRRNLVQLDRAALGVDPPDMALPKVGEIDVIHRVRNYVVNIVRARHALERFPGFGIAGRDVEPVSAGKAIVLRPHLAVDTGALRAGHVDLGGVDVALALQRPEFKGFGLAVEFYDRGLVHVADPQIALAIAAQAKLAGWEARLV